MKYEKQFTLQIRCKQFYLSSIALNCFILLDIFLAVYGCEAIKKCWMKIKSHYLEFINPLVFFFFFFAAAIIH